MPGAGKRIKALITQEIYLNRHSGEMFFDLFFFPFMNVILFGLITRFVGDIREATNAQFLLLGILLWELVAINQYSVTVSSLWSVWSHNLTNIFIAPISVAEYLTAHVVSAAIRSLAIFSLLSICTWFFFDFSILNVGLFNLFFFIINLSIFAWWIGLILLGFIFRYGTRIQAIAWGVIFLFQPLTASFFPVAVLPSAMRAVANLLPATHVFEAARQALVHHNIQWGAHALALLLNTVFLVLAWYAFQHLFRRSKQTGQFARNDL